MTASYKLGRLLNRGGWGNGDVYEARHRDGRAIVIKTYRRRQGWLGRFLIARERRAYERLQGLPGIVGVLDSECPYTLILEQVDAKPIVFAVNASNSALIRQRLQNVAAQMHSARVYHLDLRNRGNVLIDKDNNPYIIDFASALLFSSRAWPARLVERLCLAFDRHGLSKWTNLCDRLETSGRSVP